MHSSPGFGLWVPVSQKLGIDSYAAKAFEGKPVPDEMQEVSAAEWIASDWLREDAQIEEQSICMPYYKRCLSLLWAKREMENRPLEDDALLPELDADRFSSVNRKLWPGKR